MRQKSHGELISEKLTQIVRGGHKRRILITDKHNNPIIHFPVLFFAVMILVMPIVVGFLLLIFLQSDYHAIFHNPEEENKKLEK